MRLSPRLTGPAVVLGVLALTACGGGGTEAGAPAPSTAAADEKPEPSAEPTPEETEDPVAAAAECLVGTWGADNDELEASALAMFGGAEPAPVVEITGGYEQIFDGSTMTNRYGDQVSTVSMSSEGQEIRSVTTMSGEGSGAYTVDEEGLLQLEGVDTSGIVTTTETTINGEPFDAQGVQDMTLEAMGQKQTARFTCTEDTLEIVPMMEGQDAIPGFSQVLHRR